MVALRKFQTLIELLTYFREEQTCRDYLELIRWNGKIVCPYKECKHDHVHKYTDGKRYKCAKCQRQFSVKVGTIFEDSKISLQKWFAAIYLITSHKKGISSLQLHRDLGVTQKTAWFMLHRVRHTLLVSPSEKLTGIIEADETFIGGKESNKHKSKQTANTQGRSSKTKTPVLGIIERGGELRAIKILNTKGYSIRPFIVNNVEFGSQVHPDEWWGYRGLARIFRHQYINHGQGEYAKASVVIAHGVVNTNHATQNVRKLSVRFNAQQHQYSHNLQTIMLKEVIDKWKLNRNLLADKMEMSKDAFNKKLNGTDGREFTEDETHRLSKILLELRDDLEAGEADEFNDALRRIAQKEV